ncbi:Aldo/keto reductase [Polychaeton citri CBS 116435]|uniref:Aldo/keto reductase n=1 Tax=Polychaeton citri CBS 116435 TaxID=1314669 RepID=A0A9P4QGG4_9PEZI|nr:Aldo/keto reductase [Polychaeton citri CBS 116435]
MPLITGTGKPRVILGTMTFGSDTSKGARVTSLDAYKECLDVFQKAGYNEIDTARMYVGGTQEAWTRDAGYQERGLAIATKYYPTEAHAHTGEKVEATLNLSLKELGTETVDIFYLHAADRSLPFTEPLAKVNQLHKQGKFVQLGLSNFTAAEVAEVVMHCKYNGWVRPTIYQGMYNAITRSLEQELIPTCRRYGIELVVYNPVAGGILTGKYKTSEIPTEGRFSEGNSMGSNYRKRYFQDATFDALRVIEPVVAKHDLTLLETALRWCVHHSALNIEGSQKYDPSLGRDGIIIGVSSREQLEQNLKDLEKGPLPEEVLKALDEAWLIAKPTTANYWHMDLEYTYDTKKALFG